MLEKSIFFQRKFDDVIEERKKIIQTVYLNDSRPWVIGYSGGKDSTVITDLILTAISELPKSKLHKEIYVISSDTLVENPMIEDYIVENINLINKFSQKNELPISAHLIRPVFNETFWSTLIGRGYPAPNQKFRWCTDRLKIKPANKFIKDKIDIYGEVITVLGVRSSESISRAIVIENHRIDGKILKKHSTLSNAFTFTPIEDFLTDDVWKYLLTKNPNIWGSDNQFLMSLYMDSQEGECPLIVDKETPSCGNSRFGCWACTVVKEDKSLTGFLKTAIKNRDIETVNKLKPLIDFRNWLKENRNNEEFRETKRQDGSLYMVETKIGAKVGLGAYNFKTRKLILEKLLKIQKEIQIQLITIEELKSIQREWNDRLGDLNNTVNEIYKSVYNYGIFEQKQAMLINNDDLILLEKLSNDEDIDFDLIRRLLKIEQKYYGYTYKQNLYSEIDKVLSEEWIHETKIRDIKFGDKNNDNK